MPNANLYCALRSAFPADLGTAIEAVDATLPRHYSWRELDHGSARLANLLASLALPPASRIAVQTEKSVETLMLYLAVLRAGHTYLPLNTAYQAAEIAYFVGNPDPAVVVCGPRNLGWIEPIATSAGCRNVFTLADDGSGTLIDRAAAFGETQTPGARQPAEQCGHA